MKNVKNRLGLGMLYVVFSLAWPTMLEQLMQTAVQYIDTAMVGAIGTRAIAAVGSTSTVNWLIGSTVSAIGVGFLAYISQALGAGDTERSKNGAAQAVFVAFTVGLIFTIITVGLSSRVPVWMNVDSSIERAAAQYFRILYLPMIFRSANIIFGTVLRASGDTKTPMRVGIAVNLTNIALNFALIYPTRQIAGITVYGAGLGVNGAAAASAVSYTVGGIIMTNRLWAHGVISPKGCSLMPNGKILKGCFKVAFPNMLQRFATSLGYVAFAAMINTVGDTATAAHTIANTVESAFYIPGWGMQQAAAALAGRAYGANRPDRLKSLGKAIIPLEILLMCISGGLLFILAPQLTGIFSKDPEVIRLGSTVLRMVALSEPFYGISIVIEGMMQGVGNTLPPFVYNITGMWCIRIAGTFICIQLLGMGLVAAWGCMIGHNLLLFVLFVLKYRSSKWSKNYLKA